MKKYKFVLFIILCVILLQIMLILMDVEWNSVFAANTNTWDVSKNGDGSVIATLSADGTFTVSGNGKMKNYSSSNNIEYYSKKDEIKKVIINEGVTSIGTQAFYKCTSLSSIKIPNSVISIENNAFLGCTSLSSINIPESVTSIGRAVFSGCTSLSNIEIPESVTSIGDWIFYGCTSLSSINIPNGITNIGFGAFQECTNLSSINIPNSLTSIEDQAFLGCISLSSIHIPESVTSIGNSAFSRCTSLSSINLPESITSIGDWIFCKCTSLSSINIPNGITSIGFGAFQECTNLSSINIPNGLTSIGGQAFLECTSLSSINIPESVTSIGNYAFDGCDKLTIYCKTDSYAKEYVTENNLTYVIDDVAPTIISIKGNEKWTKDEITLTVNATDELTGLATEAYSFDNGQTWQAENTKTYTEKVKDVIVQVRDAVGNITAKKAGTIKIDKQAPKIESITGNENWTNDSITLTIEATDALSRLSAEAYSFDNGQTWQAESTKIYTENTQGVIVQVKDTVGNITTKEVGEIKIDKQAPTIESIVGNENWTKDQITLTVNAIDELSKLSVEAYSFDNGQTWQAEKTKIYTKNMQGVIVQVRDTAGNITTKEIGTIKVDEQAPTIVNVTANKNNTKDKVTLTVQATDALSGLAAEAYSFDNGQTWQKENTKTYTENTQGIIVKVRDAVGNIATYETININNILKIEIKDYEIVIKDNENYLTKINEKTTIAQLKEKIQTNGTVKVLKRETEITDPNTYVGTGMIIQIESEKYIAVVRADLNGDGTIGLSDLPNIKLGLIGKVDLSTAQKLAGDVNENGEMALSDMANLKMYLLKKL